MYSSKPPKVIRSKTLTLKFSEGRGSTKIEQSCNGLLCCSYSVKNLYKPEVTAYYIYNPSTKSHKVLPASPFRQDGYRSVHSVSLAFDPLKSPYYEVICYSSNNEKKNQIEIYSSKTSSWRWRLYKAPFGSERREFGLNFDMHKSGVFWNGSLHWGSDRPSVYFNIDQELVKEMPMLPTTDNNNTDEKDEDGSSTDDDNEDDSQSDNDDDSLSDSGDDTEGSMSIEYFGECGGHLCLLQISDPYGSFEFKIWEMETDYTGWTVKHHGNLKKMTRRYPELKLDEYAVQDKHDGMDFSILLVEEKEEEESMKMVIRVLDKVISYDLKKKRFKLIHKLPFATGGPEPDSPGWFEAYQFTESLASV